MDLVGQVWMSVLYQGLCDNLCIVFNLWVGVGLVCGGVGIVLVGNLQQVVECICEYQVFGISNFIFFGYLYLEEVYCFVELVMFLLLLENGVLLKVCSVNIGLFGEIIGGDKCLVCQVSVS